MLALTQLQKSSLLHPIHPSIMIGESFMSLLTSKTSADPLPLHFLHYINKLCVILSASCWLLHHLIPILILHHSIIGCLSFVAKYCCDSVVASQHFMHNIYLAMLHAAMMPIFKQLPLCSAICKQHGCLDHKIKIGTFSGQTLTSLQCFLRATYILR